jgi:hypothetical protein
LPVVLIIGSATFWSTQASAQEFDREEYERRASECVANLTHAEGALDEGENERALTYMNLAWDPCEVARQMIVEGISSGAISSRHVAGARGDLVARDCRWVTLVSRLGMCEEARELLAATNRDVPEIPEDVQGRFVEATQAVLACQPSGAGGPSLGSYAVPLAPQTNSVEGVAGGPTTLVSRFGDPCTGYSANQASFVVQMPVMGWLFVSAVSDGDLTMAVSGPSGTWCSDDVDGLNPAVYTQVGPGDYEVWVGEYSQSGSGTAFHAEFNYDLTGPTPEPQAAYTIGPGFAPASASGVAGGPGSESAQARWGEPCRGFVQSQPSFTVEVSYTGRATVQATAADPSGDLTMVFSGPGGTWCSDDFDGFNPAISQDVGQGTYQVWVGEYSATATGTPFTVRFSTDVIGDAMPPSEGPITVGPGQAPTTRSGVAGGPIDAAQRYGGPCVGFIPDQPQLTIEMVQDGRLTVEASSDGDLTMVLSGRSGIFCNDDFNGLNPALSENVAAGSYQVWLGEYSQTDTGTPFQVHVSTAELSRGATYGTARVGPGLAPSTIPGVSGGSDRADSRYGSYCSGWIAAQPDYFLEVVQGGPVRVAVTPTEGEGDTTLVITGPAGTFCNDDADGYNPAVTETLPAGTYEVYVGSYDEGEFHQVVTEFGMQ